MKYRNYLPVLLLVLAIPCGSGWWIQARSTSDAISNSIFPKRDRQSPTDKSGVSEQVRLSTGCVEKKYC